MADASERLQAAFVRAMRSTERDAPADRIPKERVWLVVEAEKDIRTAFHLVDGFLSWEAANRTTAGPSVTAIADDLRESFPSALQSAQDTLRAYKRHRTPEGRADVTAWLATVNAAMLAALRHLPPPQTAEAYRAAGTPVK